MAVLEIQANGDTRVTEEAIARARHSLSDPNMRVSSWPCPYRLALSVPRRAGAVLRAGLEVQQVWARPAARASSPPSPPQGGPYWACVLSCRREGSEGTL